MKIEKGHYVPKELITSEAIHEAVVKCFVAAGFKDCRPRYGNFKRNDFFAGLFVDNAGEISWGDKGTNAKTPLTLQQLFTAENGLAWPDWAEEIRANKDRVYFSSGLKLEFICGSTYSADSVVLATRQPKEKEVNEALDKAVIELTGVWSVGGGNADHLRIEKNLLFSEKPGDKQYICTYAEFESRAKQLGYINGFRWGVEYPTNGKRPDLPDDVILQVQHSQTVWMVDLLPVDACNYHVITAFRIADNRYKPADTSYLDGSSLTHSEESLTHKDGEIDQAIPAFCKLPNSLQDLYQESFDKWVDKKQAERKYELERNKVVEAAAQKFHNSIMPDYSGQPFIDGLCALYDAGFLKMP